MSLANDSFLDELADAYRDREALAARAGADVRQADIRTFGGSEWSALTDMRDLGFRFGVEDVTDFDYEFTALCAAGFAFVKLDAATLLSGLAAPNGTMAADEVCRNLSELGLTLIVGDIDDEAVRAPGARRRRARSARVTLFGAARSRSPATTLPQRTTQPLEIYAGGS